MKRLPNFSFAAKVAPRSMVIGAIVILVLTLLTVRWKINEEDALERYLELRQGINGEKKGKLWNEMDDKLNRRILANERLLKKKISLSIDKAIKDYVCQEKSLVTMTSPAVLEEAKRLGGTQRLILEQAIYYELSDGSMGIRGAWTKPWPNEITFTKLDASVQKP